MAGAPCKDCKDRAVGCHSACKKYLDFKKTADETKEKIRKDKLDNGLYLGFVKQQKEKARRARGSRSYT